VHDDLARSDAGFLGVRLGKRKYNPDKQVRAAR
jgi:hypothetical protein